jgi:hypothetical protein
VDSDRTAFVAMKFEGNSWNDRRYLVITEVLEEAGFVVNRGDTLSSADVVMTEVLQQLKSANMVVIDSTGDSHNVSYEIGYCHGISRDPAGVILVRRRGTDDAPFNYRHFRHLEYKDLRHLRRLLRDRLSISTPLKGGQLGFGIPFIIHEVVGLYGDLVAESIIASLKELQFSGRCEYYAGNPIHLATDLYVVALGLKPSSRSQSLTYKWWMRLCSLIDNKIKERTEKIELYMPHAEFGEMGGIRADYLPRGVAEFEDGKVMGLLGPHLQDSWFSGAIVQELAGDNTINTTMTDQPSAGHK